MNHPESIKGKTGQIKVRVKSKVSTHHIHDGCSLSIFYE